MVDTKEWNGLDLAYLVITGYPENCPPGHTLLESSLFDALFSYPFLPQPSR